MRAYPCAYACAYACAYPLVFQHTCVHVSALARIRARILHVHARVSLCVSHRVSHRVSHCVSLLASAHDQLLVHCMLVHSTPTTKRTGDAASQPLKEGVKYEGRRYAIKAGDTISLLQILTVKDGTFKKILLLHQRGALRRCCLGGPCLRLLARVSLRVSMHVSLHVSLHVSSS